MSSTRKAKNDSVYHQNRFASSPEFERGLVANLVAKRMEVVEDASERELIWFIQHLSHQAGGIASLAKDLIQKFAHLIQTPAMVEIGMKPGKILNALQVKAIRAQFPVGKGDFLLQGENDFFDIIASDDSPRPGEHDDDYRRRLAKNALSLDEKASDYPSTYPAQIFIDDCRDEAGRELENHLRELCLNPALTLKGGPWYFTGLIAALRDYQAVYIKTKSAGIFTTALGKEVADDLDYTAYSRGLTLIQGDARLGKSYAARTWCEQHPGRARFVEVPGSNDDSTFFRALARALGLGNFLNYKALELRQRVEAVLQAGDLVLVMDEAQRLWPQRNLRYGFPSRIVWVMSMANAGVPICMVATPQFIQTQKAVEKTGWNSAQLTGRISHYKYLPQDLSEDDLAGVAKAVLPEASAKVLKALAVYAKSSSRYLAAIDSIAKRARYIAMRDGRSEATADDVRKAMNESVIPSDSKLQLALKSVTSGKAARITPAPALPSPAPDSDREDDPAPAVAGRRNAALVVPGPRNRADSPASLIEA